MVRFLDWLASRDWTTILETIGGIVLLLAFIGMFCGGGDGNEGWRGM